MKYILKMAFRNISRNRRRTMLSAIAISIAVMVVLVMRGYIGGITDSFFDTMVKIDTGHIKIVHPEYHDKSDMMPLEYMVDGFGNGGYKQLIPLLESTESVEIVAPRIKFGVLLSYKGKSKSAMGLGVDPIIEDRFTSLSKVIVRGQYFGTDEDERSIIIGSPLADKLGINPGDKLTILARSAYDSLRGMTFRVKGTFRYGISMLDSKLFYVPIGAAARLLEMGNGVSELVIMNDTPEDAVKAAAEIRHKFQQQADAVRASGASKNGDPVNYKVLTWQDHESLFSFLRAAKSIYGFMYIGLMILASTVIINTTMMVIYERFREIGTMGALGMTGRQIVLLFVVEAMIISAIGSFLGTVVGGGLDFLLSIKGINLQAFSGGSMEMAFNDIIYPRFGLPLLFGSFIFGVAVASAVAYIPARRAAKVEPVEALRSI